MTFVPIFPKQVQLPNKPVFPDPPKIAEPKNDRPSDFLSLNTSSMNDLLFVDSQPYEQLSEESVKGVSDSATDSELDNDSDDFTFFEPAENNDLEEVDRNNGSQKNEGNYAPVQRQNFHLPEPLRESFKDPYENPNYVPNVHNCKFLGLNEEEIKDCLKLNAQQLMMKLLGEDRYILT